jgi:hypothetical protein
MFQTPSSFSFLWNGFLRFSREIPAFQTGPKGANVKEGYICKS